MSVYWSPGTTLEQLERAAIEEAMIFYKKNRPATSAALGISLRGLDIKLLKYQEMDKKHEEANAAKRKRDEEFLARQRGQHTSTQYDTSKKTSEYKTKCRVGLESSSESSKEPEMPMSEREEVQAVLSHDTTSLRTNRRG
jgi:hypothetical protein